MPEQKPYWESTHRWWWHSAPPWAWQWMLWIRSLPGGDS